MGIQGDIGFTIKVGLFSGLREDEMIYSHSKEICPDNAGHKRDRLHVINKPNGMTVVTLNWFRGNKQCYFFIIPTKIWDHFRRLPRFTRKEEIIMRIENREFRIVNIPNSQFPIHNSELRGAKL